MLLISVTFNNVKENTPDGCRATQSRRAITRTPRKTIVKILTIVLARKNEWIPLVTCCRKILLSYMLELINVCNCNLYFDSAQMTVTNIAILCFQWRSPFLWPALIAKPDRHRKNSRIRLREFFLDRELLKSVEYSGMEICLVKRGLYASAMAWNWSGPAGFLNTCIINILKL